MMRIRGFAVFGAFALAALFGPGQALATHVSCGDDITEDTVLDSDLLDCPLGLDIAANGVTLDLGGHTIDGVDAESSVGVINPGYRNVTIKNGTVQHYDSAISLSDVSGNLVTGLALGDNSSWGVELRRATGENRIEGNTVFRNTRAATGIIAYQAPGTHIENNVLFDNDDAIAVLYSSNTTIMNNTTFSNSFGGIEVQFASDVLVKGNTLVTEPPTEVKFFGDTIYMSEVTGGRIEGNSVTDAGVCIYVTFSFGTQIQGNAVTGCRYAGITVDDSFDTVAKGNAASSNPGSGISVERGSSDTVVVRNEASGNGNYGIAVPGGVRHASNTRIEDNLVRRNAIDGIFVNFEATGTLLQLNRANKNGDDGIDVNTNAATLTQNKAQHNGDLGIEAVPGVIDGGGNKAHANGNPLQCLNVVCK